MTEESTWQIVWSCSRSPLLVTVIPGRRPWVAGLFQTSTPGRSRRTAPWLVGTVACPRLSPPTFPGMTFSLGNHFLWASATTAIFNPEPFMKSCSAHVNKQSRAFAHKDRHHSPGWFVAAAHTRRAEEKRTVEPRRPVWFQWTPTGQSTCLDHHHSSRVCLLNHGVF